MDDHVRHSVDPITKKDLAWLLELADGDMQRLPPRGVTVAPDG